MTEVLTFTTVLWLRKRVLARRNYTHEDMRAHRASDLLLNCQRKLQTSVEKHREDDKIDEEGVNG